jgi:hypothetical protein
MESILFFKNWTRGSIFILAETILLLLFKEPEVLHKSQELAQH